MHYKNVALSAMVFIVVSTFFSEYSTADALNDSLPHEPFSLCKSMNDYPGINDTRGWNNKSGSWGCGSDYYDLKGSYTSIPDNIAYYVMGEEEKSKAKYSTIMINVNNPKNSKARRSDWISAVDFWLKTNLSNSLVNAKSVLPERNKVKEIIVGDYNGINIRSVSRYDEWPNGKGSTMVTRFYKAN